VNVSRCDWRRSLKLTLAGAAGFLVVFGAALGFAAGAFAFGAALGFGAAFGAAFGFTSFFAAGAFFVAAAAAGFFSFGAALGLAAARCACGMLVAVHLMRNCDTYPLAERRRPS
jgi:hypothetical protein